MRHVAQAVIPSAALAAGAATLDSVTALTAIAAGSPAAEYSDWVAQSAGGALLGWIGVILAAVALRVGPTALRLAAALAWLAGTVWTWSTTTALVYAAAALVAVLAVDLRRASGPMPTLRWSQRNRAVSAGVSLTVISGLLLLVAGPLPLLGLTAGAVLMAVGVRAERDGLHGGEPAHSGDGSAETVQAATVRRRRITAGHLWLGAGVIALANLVYAQSGVVTTGITTTPLVLLGGLYLVAVPLLVIGLLVAVTTLGGGRHPAVRPTTAE